MIFPHLLLLSALISSVLAIPSALALHPRSLDTSAYSTPPSTLFKVFIAGGDELLVWDNDYYHYTRVSAAPDATTFSVKVEVTGDAPTSATVHPLKTGITPKISGKTITVTMPHPQYLILKLNNYVELVILVDTEPNPPPASGTGIYNVVTKYKADNTGTNMATDAIQKAIDDAANAALSLKSTTTYYGERLPVQSNTPPQAIVYIPNGSYKVGNLVLKSNVALYLSHGARLIIWKPDSGFKKHWFKTSVNRPVTWWVSTEFDSTNVRIFGRGTLDGNHLKSVKDWGWSNDILVPIKTTNFVAEGVTFLNAALWSVTPIMSQNVYFKNVKFLNKLLPGDGAGENDCIDVMHSQHVTVVHAIAISLDDNYSTKTWAAGTDIMASWPPGTPGKNENIVFDDMIGWSICYTFKVGQGVAVDQTGVTFKNGVTYDAAIGLGIDLKWGNASVLDVTFENIDVEKTNQKNDDHTGWIVFQVDSSEDNKTSSDSGINGVTVKDITVRKFASASESKHPHPWIEGESANHMVKNVAFSNIQVPGTNGLFRAKTLKDMDVQYLAFESGLTVS